MICVHQRCDTGQNEDSIRQLGLPEVKVRSVIRQVTDGSKALHTIHRVLMLSTEHFKSFIKIPHKFIEPSERLVVPFETEKRLAEHQLFR